MEVVTLALVLFLRLPYKVIQMTLVTLVSHSQPLRRDLKKREDAPDVSFGAQGFGDFCVSFLATGARS